MSNITSKEAIANLNHIYGMVAPDIQRSLDVAIKALERPQGDCISRKDLHTVIGKLATERHGYFSLRDIKEAIDNAPTVEPICPYLSDNEVKQPCLQSPCGNDKRWCESCVSKGKCEVTSCISRGDLRKTICGMDFDFGDYYDHTDEIIERVCEKIDNAPTVEYTFEEAFQKTVCENRLYCPERPKGEWIIVDDCEQFIAKCSVCGRIEDSRKVKDYPFCHCGADMRKGGAK